MERKCSPPLVREPERFKDHHVERNLLVKVIRSENANVWHDSASEVKCPNTSPEMVRALPTKEWQKGMRRRYRLMASGQ